MSLASSLPCYKLPSHTSSSSSSSNSSSSPSSSSSSSYKFITIRSSNAEGPLRRPSAPSLRQPPSPTLKPAPSPSPPSPSPSKPASSVVEQSNSVVTVELQRKMAKELQDYFRQKKLGEASQGPFFGLFEKNEISNGRATADSTLPIILDMPSELALKLVNAVVELATSLSFGNRTAHRLGY